MTARQIRQIETRIHENVEKYLKLISLHADRNVLDVVKREIIALKKIREEELRKN